MAGNGGKRVGAPTVFVVSNNGGIAGHSIKDRFFRPEAPPIAVLLQVGYENTAEMVAGYGRKVTDPKGASGARRTCGSWNNGMPPRGTQGLAGRSSQCRYSTLLREHPRAVIS